MGIGKDAVRGVLERSGHYSYGYAYQVLMELGLAAIKIEDFADMPIEAVFV